MPRMMPRWIGLMIMVCGAAVLAQSDAVGPAVGDKFADDLRARDQKDQDRTLAELMGKNGSVVFFVRSVDWCPYCQRQVVEVNERLDDFQALGLSVVSVSVDDVEEVAEFAELHSIRYTMLADPAGAINESLGIRDHQYPVGTDAFGVPRPVLYVVDPDNTIRLRYMEPTYKTRPDLDSVLRDAAALGFVQD